MNITVQGLLEMFPDFEVMAGHDGLNRVVTTVSVMDAPDIHEWLKGGEFLLTTAYIMKDNPMAIKNLITNIDGAGAAALGIKLKRFIKELSPDITDEADRLGLPVIYIPNHYAFTDVINPVLSRIVNTQARRLAISERIHRSFTQLMINGGDASAIISTLRDILGCAVVYFDTRYDRVIYSSEDKKFYNAIVGLPREEILSRYSYYLLKTDRNVHGYLVLDISTEQPLKQYDKIALEHASTVLLLDLQKRELESQIESRYRDQFVQDMILDNIRSREELKSRSRLFGWDFAKGALALIVDIDDFKKQYFSQKIKTTALTPERLQEMVVDISARLIRSHFPNTAYTSFSDYVVYVVGNLSGDKKRLLKRLAEVADAVRHEVEEKTGFTVTIGIGDYRDSALEVHASFSEAQQAVKIARTVCGKNCTVFYSELGAYCLLAPIACSASAQEFVNRYLGMVIEHDREHGSELINTLRCIVKNNWNLKSAASEMFVHHNTMKYRFHKICELIGLDGNLSGDDKLNIALALKLLDIHG